MKLFNFIKIRRGLSNERGATMLEYSLITALLSLVSIAAINSVSGEIIENSDILRSRMEMAAGMPPEGEEEPEF